MKKEMFEVLHKFTKLSKGSPKIFQTTKVESSHCRPMSANQKINISVDFKMMSPPPA
jgi:hypothetical protein